MLEWVVPPPIRVSEGTKSNRRGLCGDSTIVSHKAPANKQGPFACLAPYERQEGSMGRKGYGASSIVYVGAPTSKVKTFKKRETRGANSAVCNRCVFRIKPGERAKQTAPGAWRHYPKCPSRGDA